MDSRIHPRIGAFARALTASLLAFAVYGAGAIGGATAAPTSASAPSCNLDPANGRVKHVIEIQFDNVHFRRDNPNVPSDIEQIHSLYNFLVDNGTVLNNNHTPLIAHTADDILTTLTGVYPANHGQAVANTFNFYTPDGNSHTALSFAYWTDQTQAFDGATDGTYNLTTAAGKGVPAPWVPFTRAGCNVGGVGTANIELERNSNVATVYGADSPEAQEAAGTTAQDATSTTADFIGIAIHCAKGSVLCAPSKHGQADLLPNEPAGYVGYNGLFGHKYVAPQISPTSPMVDLNGQPIQNVPGDGTSAFGFPGFNGMTAAISLSYVAAMQEHGVAVTYAYISAVHEQNDTALGPGDPIYEQNMRNYDKAFGEFFSRLAADGINKSNTLFVIGADENDHFAGARPTNAPCDGVTKPCAYDYSKVGPVEIGVDTLLQQKGIATTFQIHSDSAPVYYLDGRPAQTSATTRNFERAVGALKLTNPITGTNELMTNYLADQAQLRLMHMITGDASRDPTFVQFDKPDFIGVTGGLDCSSDPTVAVLQCPAAPGIDVWVHGGLAPDINHTWFSLVGPGIRHLGIDNTTWTDHTDIRPTILADLGLRDDYAHDGRPVTEILRDDGEDAGSTELGQLFKQINAPVGQLSLSTLTAATAALNSGSAAKDSRYITFDSKVSAITNDRNELVADMSPLLDSTGPRTNADEGNVEQLVGEARALLERGAAL